MRQRPAAAFTVTLFLAMPAAGQPLPTAKWLVDLGRDYALSPQAGLSDTDAEITLLFMEAASRTDAELDEAYLSQFDMLSALGQFEEAIQRLEQYVTREPDNIAAFLNWTSLTIEAVQTAESRRDICLDLLKRSDLPREVTSDLHRRLAEYHYNRGEKEASKDEADRALKDYPLNIAARRLLHALANKRDDPAVKVEETLIALAMNPGNAELAWQLANDLRRMGLDQEAAPWYQHAINIYSIVPPGQTPTALAADQAATITQPRPAPPQVRNLLKRFRRDVLDYPLNPEKYLSIHVRMDREVYEPGQPWWCTITIRNTAAFPITFGQNMMLVPDVLCSLDTRGDVARSSGPTIRISLNRKPRLMPGESITVTQTIDIGPIRSAMIGTPQQSQSVILSAVLSPVTLETTEGQQVWTAGLGGLVAEQVRFRRASLIPTSEYLDLLIQRSRSEHETTRIIATEQLAMLMAEQQHVAAGRLKTAVRAFDTRKARAAFLARIDDPEPEVRACVAEALRWLALDKDMTQHANRLARDQHWLVRGLSIRMLADQYRAKFMPALQAHAANDPDPWVRRLATVLARRFQPASRPG